MSSGRHILAGKKGGGLAGRGQRLDFVFFQGFPGKGVAKKKKKRKMGGKCFTGPRILWLISVGC